MIPMHHTSCAYDHDIFFGSIQKILRFHVKNDKKEYQMAFSSEILMCSADSGSDHVPLVDSPEDKVDPQPDKLASVNILMSVLTDPNSTGGRFILQFAHHIKSFLALVDNRTILFQSASVLTLSIRSA